MIVHRLHGDHQTYCMIISISEGVFADQTDWMQALAEANGASILRYIP